MFKLNLAVWEMTLKCNLKCQHCMVEAPSKFNSEDELSTEQGLKLIHDLRKLNCQSIILSGGEPFLRKDWEIFATRVRDLGMDLLFISNGLIFDEIIAKKLYYLKTTTMGFSIDGSTADVHDFLRGVNGSFDKVLNAINIAKCTGLKVSTATSFSKFNIHQFEDILSLMLRYNVDIWTVQVAKPIGNMKPENTISEAEYYELAKRIAHYRQVYGNKIEIVETDCFGYYSKLSQYMYYEKWTGCPAGISVVAISPNGNIKGCPARDDIQGNVKTDSLIQIWKNMNSFPYNRCFSRDALIGYCQECDYGTLCRGGCVRNIKRQDGGPYCLHKIETIGYDQKS